MSERMSERKSSRGPPSASKSGRQQQTQHLFIPDEHLLLVYHAQLSRDYLMLCLKDSIIIFHTTKRSIYRQHRVKSQCAVFVPNTHYIAYANADSDDLRSCLHVWDFEKDSIESRLTFSFDIVTLKASHRCLIFASLTSLYVVHFPTLKPIFNDAAGNGFDIVYDISKEGLTIVHSTETKGQVLIRNFTNRQTNKYIAEIRSTDKKVSDRIRRLSSKRIQEIQEEGEEEVKSQIQVKAHHQHISIVRLSPNGFRFVSASTKGTVLRLFSCLNGELISQFNVCAALSNIVDIHFIAEGNAVVCLNNQNHIKLFHTKMSEQELICQTLRRGKEVYEQENPRSWLSFLGFLNEEFRYEQPFSYFNLETLSTNKDIKLAQPKIIPSNLAMSEIKEEPHQKESFLQSNENESANNESVQKEKSEEIEITQIVIPSNSSNERPNSIRQAQLQQVKMARSSLSKKRKNATSLKSLVKRQSEVTMMIREPDMNFRGIIMFENHINIRAFKGKYYYQLKYDPFNGGEMMIKQGKFNILEALKHQ